MKRIYILGSMLALVMASCSNDELVEKTGLNHNEIKVTAVLEPKARVSFEADGDVTHAYWNEGDQITIYDESQGALDYQLIAADEASGSATFAPLGNSVQYTEETVYAIYPATPVVDGVAAIPNTDVWEEGKPMPFAYAYGKMDQSTLVLEFHHHFAYLKLTLNAETVADSENKEITGIQLTNTSATYPIAVVGGKYNFIQKNSTSQGGINSMVFNLKEPFTATGDAEKVVYIPVLTQPSGETITINVLSGTETLLTVNKETPESGFVAGNAYAFSPKTSYTREDNTITITEPGTLSQAISEEEKYALTSLKIIGPLNGDDIRFIREMAGVDVEGMPTDGKLTDLDLSEATIVEGGGYYYSDGNRIVDHYSSNDVVCDFMFHCSVLEKITLPNSVNSIGAYAFSECSYLEDVVIPEGIVSIGNYAFNWCIRLSKISLPNTMTSIGEFAFNYCESLTDIVMNDGLSLISGEAFRECTRMVDINIPQSVDSIGNGAFERCNSLVSIIFPDGVKTIGPGTFSGCSSLKSVIIPESVTSIGHDAFAWCETLTEISLPNSLKTIDAAAFAHSGLTAISLPNSVISIGNGAFQQCTSLVEVKLGNGLTFIDQNAFHTCTALAEIVIPDGVTSIGHDAFAWCETLTEISLPNSLKTIDAAAFAHSGLTAISLPNSVISIGNGAFRQCTSLVEVKLGNGLTFIDQNAFHTCTALAEIVIPDGVTSIENYTFTSCESLANVTIGSGVTSIGDGAFNGTPLSEITLPAALASIGTMAFYNCPNLGEVTSEATIPPTLNSDAFTYISSSATLFVSTDCVTAYSSSDWANYFTTIEEM